MNSAQPTSTWTEEQVRRFLAEEPPAYQNIKLPYGLETGGDDRSATCRAIFPDDLTGKSVLDIGSLTGYFCFEALRRGAQSAVGIEVHPKSVRQARLLADCLGLPAEFQHADFERDTITGMYDYVLCLNVLHHLKDPLAALEKMVRITREKLVLEVASIGYHDRRKLGLSRFRTFFLRRSPILFVERLEGKSGQKFFFTPSAVERLLMSHRKSFAAVDILPSEHKDRFMAIAQKRHIRRLIVVAGPTSSGKSTLIRRLLAGELPLLEEQLNFGRREAWQTVSAKQLPEFPQGQVDQLIFHYDYLRAIFKSSKTWDRDEVLDLLECADELTFVTVYTPPERLRQQIDASEILPKTVQGVFRGNKRHLRVRKQYDDAPGVDRTYRNWVEFALTKSSRHLVVSFAPDLTIQSGREFVG